MVTIIKEAHTEYSEELNLEYRYRDDTEAGFSFPWKDYKWCQDHPEEVECLGVVERKSSCRVPALARCECGEEFHLNGHYYGCTQCPGCLRWYAMNGYEVTSPDQWEEDFEED